MTNYAHVENFVSGLNPPLLRLYIQNNQLFRNQTWEETIKKVRETEVKLKLGEDPIFRDNRWKYQRDRDRDQGHSLADMDGSARLHRQQAAKQQQEIVDMRRRLKRRKLEKKHTSKARKKYMRSWHHQELRLQLQEIQPQGKRHSRLQLPRQVSPVGIAGAKATMQVSVRSQRGRAMKEKTFESRRISVHRFPTKIVEKNNNRLRWRSLQLIC